MAGKHVCQSCSMPLDSLDLWGTEKDGTKTNEYCKYCYQHGQFIHPETTLDDMQEHMVKLLEKEELPKGIIERSVDRLPFLKRWTTKETLM